MWPTKNTAFLVIHGNGPHRQYETLDKFARNFWEYEVPQNHEIDWEHRLDDRARSYVRFKRPGYPYIDLYEYYWDRYMVRDITNKELNVWLNDINDGMDEVRNELSKLYPGNYEPPILLKVAKSGLPGIRLNRFLNGITKCSAQILLSMLSIPCIKKFFLRNKAVKDWLGVGEGWLRMLSEGILDVFLYFTKDIAIYCLHNQRSSYYNIKENVLSGAVSELTGLLNSGEKYEQIIVVGHSLGSVIAYDALARIDLDVSLLNMSLLSPSSRVTQASAQKIKDSAYKIKGLVTFGSFLDVAACFFQEHVPKENELEKLITIERHAYKKPAAGYKDNPINYDLLNVKWLNFYHPDDVVADRPLRWYELDKDDQISCYHKERSKAGKLRWCCLFLNKIPFVSWIPLTKSFVKSMNAHGSYWEDKEMYQEIASRFFQ